MMALKKLQREDIEFTDAIDKDRICTYVQLNDYSWMYYRIMSILYTKKYGKLELKFSYTGFQKSEMSVIQSFGEGLSRENNVVYNYVFNSDIFEKYVKRYLEEQLKAWDSEFAFNGGDIVLDFYNEVIENHFQCFVEEKTEKNYCE